VTQLIELIRGMGVPFSTAIVIVLFICLTSLVVLIAGMIEAFVRHRLDLRFKREMLDRGMSVDEIEQLLGAVKKNNDVKETELHSGRK
jgi:hypothetical protein